MKSLFGVELSICLGAAMLLGGCSAAQVNLADGDQVPVYINQHGPAKVVEVSARPVDGSLLVKGWVERPFPSRIRGHVDIAVYGIDGELIEKTSVDSRNVMQRRGRSRVAFKVQLDHSANAASVVNIAYHGKSNGFGKSIECDENKAVRDS